MAVDVRLPTVLRSQAGGASVVSVDGATIGEVLAKLVAEYPGMAGQVLTDDGALHKFVNIYVDDDDVRYLQGLDTPVADGAEVSILPAVAGRLRRGRSDRAGAVTLYPSVLDLIGNTPLVDITALSPNPAGTPLHQARGAEPRRFGQGPRGAVAGRGGRAHRRARAGRAGPGAHGAHLGQHRHRARHGVPGQGVPLKAVMPTNVSVERRQLLELWGAEIIESPGPRAPTARCAWPGAWPRSTPSGSSSTSTPTRPTPRRTTRGPGPRSCATAPAITHFVAGLGTSGTLLGVGRFLREKFGEKVQIWAVEPPAGEMVDGLRNLDDGYIPPIFEYLGGADLLDRKTVVRPRESIEWTRRLTEVGIFAGISTGAAAGRRRQVRVVAPRGRGGVHRGRLRRRRLEVPLHRRLDRRPRRGHRAGQGDHLLLRPGRPYGNVTGCQVAPPSCVWNQCASVPAFTRARPRSR